MNAIYNRNSENTVSAEYQSLMGIYTALLVPLMVIGATHPSLSPLTGNLAGDSVAITTSPKFRHWMIRNSIEAMTGEEYHPSRGGRNSKSDSDKKYF